MLKNHIVLITITIEARYPITKYNIETTIVRFPRLITAFKCQIRKRQLTYALDALESEKNPYKIDQLTAMRWARTA